MLVWLLKHGETLPVQDDVPKMRSWNLSESLVNSGHEVIWWCSTFSHQKKKLLYKENKTIKINNNFYLNLINAGSYKKNLSLKRIFHHLIMAYKFRNWSKKSKKPDIIVCSYPLIELAEEAVRFSKKNNIPLILDVRDQWPETFLLVAPKFLRPIVYIYTFYLKKRVKYIFNNAYRLSSMSLGCLKWAESFLDYRKVNNKVFYIGFKKREIYTNKLNDNFISKLKQKLIKKKIFVYAGTIGSFYDLETIISVASLCQHNNLKNFSFVIAGAGDNLNYLKNKSKNLPNVIFTGWLNTHQIHQLLGFSHVGLLPYKDFGAGTFPNKPAEYFYYGLPVISTINGEIEDLINEYEIGINVPYKDTHQFYRAVNKIGNNPELLKKYSNNAKKMHKIKFDANKIYADFVKYIEETRKKYV